jgi:hypothetical protein
MFFCRLTGIPARPNRESSPKKEEPLVGGKGGEVLFTQHLHFDK